MNTSGLFTTTLAGGNGGVPFDDTPLHRDKYPVPISKIAFCSDGEVLCINVYYSWNAGRATAHGNCGGNKEEMILSAGEYITRVEGRVDRGSHIVALTFLTNQRIRGPYGGNGGDSFVWDGLDGTPSCPGASRRFLAFSGAVQNNQYVSGLRGIFCDYPEDTGKTIRYEPRSIDAGPSKAIVVPGVSKSFSSFTLHIMNPIITLYVGEARVQFHVHKDSLCQLPFFQAALSRDFKEASNHALTLPEDDPSHVSALIEFLYTGSYTYAYDSESVQLSAGSTAPTGDIAEGLFHIGIYVIASRYVCQGLLEIATRHFELAESELEGIEALRLWKVAYAVDMRFSARTKGSRGAVGLAAWVNALFRDHREEMEDTFDEYPMLASDILRVSTGSV